MAKSQVVQTSFLSGVLDPRAAGRVETDAYNNGLLRGINIEPVHLGGVRRRRGLRYRTSLPNKLTRITSLTPTAPRGGTAANANDADESTFVVTTTGVGTFDPYVVVQYDLGSAQTVLFADVVSISSDGGSSTQFAIQYSTDSASWTTLGTALESVSTSVTTYRRAGSVSARYWRVAKIGGTDMGGALISLGEFNLWQDSGVVSDGRLFSFEVATDEQYTVAVTDRSATVFLNGVLTSRQPLPYASADLRELYVAANAETMALVHEDYAPRFLIRVTPTDFQQFAVSFDSVPQIDFADSLSPTPVSDVQVIVFDGTWSPGDTFQISLMGAKTAPITFVGDAAASSQNATAANIAREVQKLWTVSAFSGVQCSRTGVLTYTVSFTEGSAGAYELLGVTGVAYATSTSPKAAVTHTTTGTSRKEPVWSATRGYPGTVEFFESRMYFGGTRSRQQSVMGSRVNDVLNFEIGEGLADDPIFTTLNGAQLNAIQGLFAGRSLQLFTTGGEFRYAKEQGAPITPGDAPVNQTRYGSAKIRPVTLDGATLYVQRNRKSVRDFRFSYAENAYDSLGVSALAPHLIYDVKDMSVWNGSAVDEIGLVFVVNGENPDTSSTAFPDGTVAVFNSRKEAQVQAWTIWTTDGAFVAVSTVREDIFFLVQRTLNGVETLTLEQADPDYYLDCAVRSLAGSATVSGLSHLNGLSCRVRADGFVLPDVTPAGGSATASQAADDIEIGLDWTPEVTPMPLQTFSPQGSNVMRKKRIVSVALKVHKSLGILANGQPLPDRYFDVDSFGAAAAPFTGTHKVEFNSNFDETQDKLISFTQVDPLPMEILALDVQLEGDV